MSRPESLTRDRWVMLSRDWDLILRDPILHALVSQWAKDGALTLRWVAYAYVRRTRDRIEKMVAEGVPAAHCMKWLPSWQSEAHSIEDSPEYEHTEALRVCAVTRAILNIAFDVAHRHYELNYAPYILSKRGYFNV